MAKISDAQKKLWGPTGWYVLHQLTFYYQPQHYNIYRHIFKNLLGSVLPCHFCQKHYNIYIKSHPFPKETADQTDIIQWVLDYHNDVNQMTAKSSSIPHVAPILNQQDLRDLYFIAGTGQVYPPINHKYITGFLKITRIYHKLNKSMAIFRNFMYHVSKIFPCYKCRKRLNERLSRASRLKASSIPKIPYIRIMSKHVDNKLQLSKQRVKIKNVP
jgi:hypothetical protein